MPEHWEVVGHKKIISYLQHCLQNGKINQSYLFYGPKHLGKKKIAESFIFSLFCTSQTQMRPCGHCQACSQIKKNIHPDVFWLEIAEDKRNISITQIRQLINKLEQKALLGSYKVAVIKAAENLSLAAANALLKTLEEPAQNTVLILLTESLEHLPATILSRCQLLHFSNIAERELEHYLETLGATHEEAQNLSVLSQGRPGIALTLWKDKKAYKQYQEKMEILEKILTASGNNNDNFKLLEKILRSKQVADYLDLGISYLSRQLLKTDFGQMAVYTNLNNWLQAKKMLEKNVQAKIVLENLIINNK